MDFISCRRYLLDECWKRSLGAIVFPVLDLGGVKINRRGSFQIPEEKISQWVTLNFEASSAPDILAELPIIPIENESFPTVVLTEVLEYVSDYQKLIQEIHRVLKNEGTLILSVPFLSPLHGDKSLDKLRFTETHLKNLLSPSFDILQFERLGGVMSVTVDNLRSCLLSRNRPLDRLLWKSIKLMALLMIKLEKYLFPENQNVNTGFWIVARKKAE